MYLGIDLVEIKKFKKLAENESFLNKFYTKNEVEYCLRNGVKKHQCLAGIYSAKEAFLKALSVGIGGGINLNKIEILHHANGAPYLNISNDILEKFKIKNYEIKISISHTQNYATAICMILENK